MLTALINEELCIGCNRCVPACPFDAILGARQYMHTVLTDECVGCKLCLDPCPVDCIDIIPLGVEQLEKIDKKSRALKAKDRYQKRIIRLQKKSTLSLPLFNNQEEKSQQLKREIQDSIARAAAKTRR